MTIDLSAAGHPDGSTDPALDPARLADVLRGRHRTARDFLADFRRSTDADFHALLAACLAGDHRLVERLAHRIEGASQVIGAAAMGEACRRVAQASRSGQQDALRAAIARLVERKQALDACLDQLPVPAVSAVSAVSDAAAAATADAICAGLSFLVAEDHAFQRGLIVRQLRQLGAREVHGFADGASALEAARALRSQAILVLDLAMPALSGMDVLRMAGQEQLAVSVILNSALDEGELQWPLQQARSWGATVLGAVTKPLTAAKLTPLLAQHRRDQRPATAPRLASAGGQPATAGHGARAAADPPGDRVARAPHPGPSPS